MKLLWIIVKNQDLNPNNFFGILAQNFTGSIGQIFETLNLQSHFESISRGVIDSKDLVYFLSITVLGLYLGESSLSKRHSS